MRQPTGPPFGAKGLSPRSEAEQVCAPCCRFLRRKDAERIAFCFQIYLRHFLKKNRKITWIVEVQSFFPIFFLSIVIVAKAKHPPLKRKKERNKQTKKENKKERKKERNKERKKEIKKEKENGNKRKRKNKTKCLSLRLVLVLVLHLPGNSFLHHPGLF